MVQYDPQLVTVTFDHEDFPTRGQPLHQYSKVIGSDIATASVRPLWLDAGCCRCAEANADAGHVI